MCLQAGVEVGPVGREAPAIPGGMGSRGAGGAGTAGFGGNPECAASGVCPNGAPCSGANDCGSGRCVDDVCCDGPCSALCQACSNTKTGTSDGTCAAVRVGTDPDSECGFAELCHANLSCEVMPGWIEHFGGPGSAAGRKLAVDGSASVLVAGSFSGTVDFGGGPLTSAGGSDIVLAKFDSDGGHLFSKRLGGATSQYDAYLAVDGSGSVFLAGNFIGTVDLGGGQQTAFPGSSDIFLAKYDSNGDYLFSKRFGGGGWDFAYALVLDGLGNALVAGTFDGAVNFGGEPLISADGWGLFFAKYDSNGGHLFSKGFGGGYIRDLAVDGAGNVLTLGALNGTEDLGGGPLTSAGDRDVVLAKYDSSGGHLFSKRFGGADFDSPVALVVDSSGSVFVTGVFEGAADFGGGPLTSAGDSDIFIAKYDSNGGHLFSKRFGGGYEDVAQAIAIDGSGNVFRDRSLHRNCKLRWWTAYKCWQLRHLHREVRLQRWSSPKQELRGCRSGQRLGYGGRWFWKRLHDRRIRRNR